MSHPVRIPSLIMITVLLGGAILGTLTVSQPVNAQSKAGCSDGIDNDGDGAIDLADIECTDRDILDDYEADAEFYATCQDDRADGDRNFDGDIWDTKGCPVNPPILTERGVLPQPPPPPPTNSAPTAFAGDSQTVDGGTKVYLSGSGRDPDPKDRIFFSWSQVAGPVEVRLSTLSKARTTFTAPYVDVDTTFTFQLIVSDSRSSSQPSNVNIIVRNNPQDQCGGIVAKIVKLRSDFNEQYDLIGAAEKKIVDNRKAIAEKNLQIGSVLKPTLRDSEKTGGKDNPAALAIKEQIAVLEKEISDLKKMNIDLQQAIARERPLLGQYKAAIAVEEANAKKLRCKVPL